MSSIATRLGTSQETAAIPQSEASLARTVPRVAARRFTTAILPRQISTKSSSLRSPESLSTSSSEEEAETASKHRFIPERKRLLTMSTEMKDPMMDRRSATVTTPRQITRSVTNTRGQSLCWFGLKVPLLPSRETPQKLPRTASSKDFFSFVGKPTLSYCFMMSLRRLAAVVGGRSSGSKEDRRTRSKQTKSSMTMPSM